MPRKTKILALERNQLDRRLKPLRKANLSAPSRGWIRAIRTALGMSATQLAKRLSVTPQTIKDYEEAEEKDAISISTIKRIANALGCQAHLILIPRTSLDAMVKDQALKVATKIVDRVDLNMRLEAQGTSKGFRKRQTKELAEEITRTMGRELWER